MERSRTCAYPELQAGPGPCLRRGRSSLRCDRMPGCPRERAKLWQSLAAFAKPAPFGEGLRDRSQLKCTAGLGVPTRLGEPIHPAAKLNAGTKHHRLARRWAVCWRTDPGGGGLLATSVPRATSYPLRSPVVGLFTRPQGCEDWVYQYVCRWPIPRVGGFCWLGVGLGLGSKTF